MAKFFGTAAGQGNFNNAKEAFIFIEEFFRGGNPVFTEGVDGPEEIHSFDQLLKSIGQGDVSAPNIAVVGEHGNDKIEEAMGGLNTVSGVVNKFRAQRGSILQNFTPTAPSEPAKKAAPTPQAPSIQAPTPRPLPKLGEIPGTPNVTNLGSGKTVEGNTRKPKGRASTIFTSRRGVEGPAPIKLAQLSSGSRPLLGS